MNKKFFILSLIIFILAISVRVYYIFQKQGFHTDEMLSRVVMVGKGDLNAKYLVFNNKFYSGKIIKNFYFGKSNQSLYTDLKNLRINNYLDDAHPSLYYSLLRVAFHFSDISPQGFIYAGCGLNLFLFIFSFFIMRKLLIRLFGDNKLVPIGLAIAFLNTGSISVTLFIRPYELQMLAIILISYVFLIYQDKLKSNDNIFNLKDGLTITLSVAFVFWTSYFLVSYVGLLGILLLWYSRKNLKNLASLLLYVIFSIGVTLSVNTGYFQFLHGQRFDNISQADSTFNAFDYFYNFITYFCNLTKFLFYILILIVSLLSVFFINKTLKSKAKTLIICTFLWSVIVATISPFPVVRYILPTFPILSLILINYIYKLKNKAQYIFSYTCIFIYILAALFPLKLEAVDTNFIVNKKYKYIPFGGTIENLYIGQLPELNSELPVIIQNYYWFSPLSIFYDLNDDQQYNVRFLHENKFNLNEYPAKDFYIFVDNSFLSFTINPKYELIPLGNYMKYKCYEVRSKS